MRFKITYGFIFAVLLLIGPYTSAEQMTWSDLGQELLSPFESDARMILLIGSGATAVTSIGQIKRDTQREMITNKPLGEFASTADLYGQGIPNLIYVLANGIHWYGYSSMGARRRTLLMAKATAYSTVVGHMLKLVTHEARPDGGNHDSFPSGHSTAAFTFAGVVLYEHGWMWGVPALALAATTGVQRLSSNHHYLHDVMAGATLGLSYAAGLYAQQKTTGDTAWRWTPLITPEMAYIDFSKSF